MKFQRQIADFVEEQGAVVSSFKTANMPLHSAGKGPLFVAKQLAFEQSRRQRTAIERDKGLPATLAQAVDSPSEYALAHAGLAQHQHCQIGLRDLFDLLQKLDHGLVLGEQVRVRNPQLVLQVLKADVFLIGEHLHIEASYLRH